MSTGPRAGEFGHVATIVYMLLQGLLSRREEVCTLCEGSLDIAG